jgi:hypothetical protein
MRYRILAILITLMAIAGLSAPAAFAASGPPLPSSCIVGDSYGSFHVMANAKQSLGITYHGPGNPVTVTSSPGDSTFVCVVSPSTYVIHNDAGNCFRMQDASNDFAIIEQTGCLDNNTNYQFQAFPHNGDYQFENVHFQKWLGTASCPPGNGTAVVGVPNAAGNCLTWLLQ